MKSLTELYKIGKGPSSSHTMGPQKAAIRFSERHPSASRFEVVLYGSLAKIHHFVFFFGGISGTVFPRS